jgi:hypothetical protein
VAHYLPLRCLSAFSWCSGTAAALASTQWPCPSGGLWLHAGEQAAQQQALVWFSRAFYQQEYYGLLLSCLNMTAQAVSRPC